MTLEIARAEAPSRSAHTSRVAEFKERVQNHLSRTVGKGAVAATERDWYDATAYAVRDLVAEKWVESAGSHYEQDVKRVYYLSVEFLLGRSLIRNLLSTGYYDACREAFDDMGLDLERIAAQEPEAALGNGGLGRLAACLVGSMASLGVPGYGYGIRYDYGMFSQYIENGEQREMPDDWLRFGNRWEFARPQFTFPVKFYGRVIQFRDERGTLRNAWVDTQDVSAMAYDQLLTGYKCWTVSNVRLWAARSQEFDLMSFNRGDYLDAVRDQAMAGSLSRVLYPDDTSYSGKTLRLQQEYFFVSASLQDILRRYSSTHPSFDEFADKVAIQLNDTHPAIAVAELMRLFVDIYELEWAKAWDITVNTFAYTNHTLMPEALETWQVSLFEVLLPRHLQIIYEINFRFLEEVRHRHPGDFDLVRRLSLIDEDGERRIRMAHLAFVGSHKINGVAALHTELMKSGTFKDLHEYFPDRIVNKTNGITPRRWLNQANRPLSRLITERIGDSWLANLDEVRALEPLADDAGFREEFRLAKRQNKERLARYVRERLGVEISLDAMYDVQVKRMHEYKRQLLNLLHVVTLYNRLRSGHAQEAASRVVIFAGKAAPAYLIAKQIIRLINDVGDVINNDPAIGNRLKVLFLPNYNVSQAEVAMPAADLSEQISTAGTEASGTGNMKFALNGALTIGTRDGANIEIGEEVGEDNIFFFGLTADQVEQLRWNGYDPWSYYHNHAELRQVLDMINGGYFSPRQEDRYREIFDLLTVGGDHFMLMADYEAYIACQERVDAEFRDPDLWWRKAILNTARMGKFSSDRTVLDYASGIWDVQATRPDLNLRSK